MQWNIVRRDVNEQLPWYKSQLKKVFGAVSSRIGTFTTERKIKQASLGAVKVGP